MLGSPPGKLKLKFVPLARHSREGGNPIAGIELSSRGDGPPPARG